LIKRKNIPYVFWEKNTIWQTPENRQAAELIIVLRKYSPVYAFLAKTGDNASHIVESDRYESIE
jgi:hypothetical protein